jgi:sphingomyelin phosphodiesterase
LIIWTGDNPAHTIWNNNADEIYNITAVFIDLLYNKYNYKKPVFPSLGNHEEFIADQYDPFTNREVGFLSTMSKLFSNWLSEEEQQMFSKYGYYSKKYLNTNLRIISMNCFLCDTLNFYLIENPTDPQGQFSWMEKTLRDAEKNGEYVFIIGHIPPGDTTFTTQCAKRYQALVDRFSNIVRGNFYGHTHYDEFRLMTEYFNHDKISGVIYTTPSLTTYESHNPSFRVYEVESKNMIMKNYYQYRLNITKANSNPFAEPEWEIVYNAREVISYNLGI